MYQQGRLGACESGTGETLLSFTKRIKRLHENKLITFIVLGTEKYFRFVFVLFKVVSTVYVASTLYLVGVAISWI